MRLAIGSCRNWPRPPVTRSRITVLILWSFPVMPALSMPRHRSARNHTRAGHMPASKTSEPHTIRVALVTGAAHDIGQAIAAGLAERGTRIVLGDIDEVSEASDLTGDTGHPAVPVTPDVSDPSSIEAAHDRVTDPLGRVDLQNVRPGGPYPVSRWTSPDVHTEGPAVWQAGQQSRRPSNRAERRCLRLVPIPDFAFVVRPWRELPSGTTAVILGSAARHCAWPADTREPVP